MRTSFCHIFEELLDIVKYGYPKAIQQWAAEYGPLFKLWQGGTVIVATDDPTVAR